MIALMSRLTRAVRAADKHFEQVGGSSRHWVIECFLPALEDEGLEIVDTVTLNERIEHGTTD